MSDTLSWIPLLNLATSVAVLVGILLTNVRISDLATSLNNRISDLRTDTFQRFADTFQRFDDLKGEVHQLREQYSRVEGVVVGKLAEVEARLARIESGLHPQ